jgi:carboxymethylenebutenolidase
MLRAAKAYGRGEVCGIVGRREQADPHPDPALRFLHRTAGVEDISIQMADRLGAAGFVALAPDLYHGELAGHDEMDKAARLMQRRPSARAAT